MSASISRRPAFFATGLSCRASCNSASTSCNSMLRAPSTAGDGYASAGSPDRSSEERVPGNQQLFRSKVQADASRGMPGCMQNLRGIVLEAHDKIVFGACIWRCDFGRLNAQPPGLHLHHFEQRQILLVEQNGRSGSRTQLGGSAHVIDVSVSDDDLFYLKLMLANDGKDVLNVVPGINDHSLVRALVTNNRAVALQRANRKDFVDHEEAFSTQLSAFSPCACFLESLSIVPGLNAEC